MSSHQALQEDQLLELLLQLKVRCCVDCNNHTNLVTENNPRTSSSDSEFSTTDFICSHGRYGQFERDKRRGCSGRLCCPLLLSSDTANIVTENLDGGRRWS